MVSLRYMAVPGPTYGTSFYFLEVQKKKPKRHATPSPTFWEAPQSGWKNKSAAVMRALILTNVIAYTINFFFVFTQEEQLAGGRDINQ